jgi:hypothetical protein
MLLLHLALARVWAPELGGTSRNGANFTGMNFILRWPHGGAMSLEVDHAALHAPLVQASRDLQKVLASFEREQVGEALGHDLFAADHAHPSEKGARAVLKRIKERLRFTHGGKCPLASHRGRPCAEASFERQDECDATEAPHMCSHVEVWSCDCGALERLPRYRSVGKLLQTKRGRCGEFSDVAFGVFERLGYAPRHVVDYTDHVWVEVSYPGAGGARTYRHADPSEGRLDEPLMYADEWQKEHTFIFASTADDATDRVPAYTHATRHAALVARRGMSDREVAAQVALANLELDADATPQSSDRRPRAKAALIPGRRVTEL